MGVKMIKINLPMKQDFVIELLDGKTHDDVTFNFVEKKGMILSFSIGDADKDTAIAVAKKVIKSTEIGSVLYFQVS